MLIVRCDRTIITDLRAVASELKNLSVPLNELKPIVQRRVQQQFGVSNNSWRPLSPAYARRKAKVAPGMPTLILSGDMYREYGREGVVSGNNYTYGNQYTYSKYHQDGTRYMAARQVDYGFVEEQAATLVEKYADRTLTAHNL